MMKHEKLLRRYKSLFVELRKLSSTIGKDLAISIASSIENSLDLRDVARKNAKEDDPVLLWRCIRFGELCKTLMLHGLTKEELLDMLRRL